MTIVNNRFDILVIGGGAAGFFGAIHAALNNPSNKICILEKSLKVLSKVRISGGGRCNVTHACFDPRKLVEFYPRGSKELLGPFTRFQPKDTMEWFQKHGVELKTEEDGRIFPVTDSSETIIQCLTETAKELGVELHIGVSVKEITREQEGFIVTTSKESYFAKKILLASGSSPQGHEWAKQLGHTITPLIPSLFTFNVPTSPFLDLAGIAIPKVTLSIEKTPLKETGPLLLTHWGFSGPAVLRLSAWGAKELHDLNYHATLIIDWTGGEDLKDKLETYKRKNPSQLFSLDPLVNLPKNLSKRLLNLPKSFGNLSKEEMQQILRKLTEDRYVIEGKTTYKNEFVTCGGIKLSEVNFKTMESKICPGLYFAGEVLDIDGITGGFNFQNAWTGGFIAGNSI